MNIILVGVFLFGLVTMIVSFIKGHDFVCGFGTGIVLTCMVAAAAYQGEPNAMDVYQGKTAIQYTVVDGVKVDSCVVYKKDIIFITIDVQ
jgi:hypothetical protein